jgi:hypothetical protein
MNFMARVLSYLLRFSVLFVATIFSTGVTSGDEYEVRWDFFAHVYKMDELPDGSRQAAVWWNDWRIESSGGRLPDRDPGEYPLTYLCDGDPRTAWVFDGDDKHSGLSLSPSQPKVIDSFQIMNGYNRRPDLFKRNNRIVEMEVWTDGRKLKTVRLSDKMGWHRISLPRRKISQLGLVFTGFARGRDNDVCVSEIAFFDGARKLPWSMPNSVLYDAGNASGDAPLNYALISRNGKPIVHFTETQRGYSGSMCWSDNQRYVCYIGTVGTGRGSDSIWIVDCARRRIVKQLSLSTLEKDMEDRFVAEIKWQSNREVEITTASDFDSKGYVEPKKYTVRVPY